MEHESMRCEDARGGGKGLLRLRSWLRGCEWSPRVLLVAASVALDKQLLSPAKCKCRFRRSLRVSKVCTTGTASGGGSMGLRRGGNWGRGEGGGDDKRAGGLLVNGG